MPDTSETSSVSDAKPSVQTDIRLTATISKSAKHWLTQAAETRGMSVSSYVMSAIGIERGNYIYRDATVTMTLPKRSKEGDQLDLLHCSQRVPMPYAGRTPATARLPAACGSDAEDSLVIKMTDESRKEIQRLANERNLSVGEYIVGAAVTEQFNDMFVDWDMVLNLPDGSSERMLLPRAALVAKRQ